MPITMGSSPGISSSSRSSSPGERWKNFARYIGSPKRAVGPTAQSRAPGNGFMTNWEADSGSNLTQQGTDDQPVKRHDDGQIGTAELVVCQHQRRRGDI